MPEITRLQLLQFFLLVFALPAQYMLVKWSGKPNEESRDIALQKLIQSFSYYKDSGWKTLLLYWNNLNYANLLQTLRKVLAPIKVKIDIKDKIKSKPATNLRDLRDGESLALEVFKFRRPEGHFAGSTMPRSPRDESVKYRVGQVFKHKIHGYRGVIIGWDAKCKAPDSWIKLNHGNNKNWQDMPNYSVLVDNRDLAGDQSTYVAQENIEIVSNTQVTHKQLYDYFNFFDGAQYHMRPALQHIYPRD